MELRDHDLRQIDIEYWGRLTHVQLLHVSGQLLSDLKEARERANQTLDNSSRPPESFAPWEGESGEHKTPGSAAAAPRSEPGGAAGEAETEATRGPFVARTGVTRNPREAYLWGEPVCLWSSRADNAGALSCGSRLSGRADGRALNWPDVGGLDRVFSLADALVTGTDLGITA